MSLSIGVLLFVTNLLDSFDLSEGVLSLGIVPNVNR